MVLLCLTHNPDSSTSSSTKQPFYMRLEMSSLRDSYEDAASALGNVAPVKVLLFRRAVQLQDLICRPNPVSAATIEDAIDAALHVYNQWNKT